MRADCFLDPGKKGEQKGGKATGKKINVKMEKNTHNQAGVDLLNR